MSTTAVGNLFAPLASLASAPLLAQGLGVEGRGETAAVVAPLLLVTLGATFGIPAALTFFSARDPRLVGVLLRRGTRLLFAAGLMGSVVVVASSTVLAADDPQLSTLIAWSALGVVPTLMAGGLQAIAAGANRWQLIAADRFVAAAVRLGAIACLSVTGQLTVVTAVLVLAMSPAVGATVYVRLIVTFRTEEVPVDGGRGISARILGYGSRVWIGSVSGVILARLDQVVMVPLADARQLGLYAVAVTVGELPLLVNSAVRDVMFSADASSNQSEVLGRSARISTLAVSAVAAMMAVSALWWIPPVFGADFAGAVPLAAVILVAAAVNNPGSVAGAGLAARGRPGLRSLSLAVAGAVNLALVFALVPSFGAMGAAVATLAGGFVSSNLNIVLLWRACHVDPRAFYGVRRDDISLVRGFVTRAAKASRVLPARVTSP
ncbi:MAG: teichoic acid transporter [Frondihabitans sp.]|nr:teichoic acid transporter [Frondihabitans sp.]